MNKTTSAASLKAAYLRAHRAELEAVDALPDHATKRQTDRCWRLADATNAARKALEAAWAAATTESAPA